jgi:hypothetical protein
VLLKEVDGLKKHYFRPRMGAYQRTKMRGDRASCPIVERGPTRVFQDQGPMMLGSTLGIPLDRDVLTHDAKELRRVADIGPADLAGKELSGGPEISHRDQEAHAIRGCLERLHQGAQRLREGKELFPLHGCEYGWSVEGLLFR